MSGKRLNYGERNYVKKFRKAAVAEQRMREEFFNTVSNTDRKFGSIAATLNR